MKKETDRLQIEKVPVYKSLEQTIEEYLEDIRSYCVRLHNETKDFGFEHQEAKMFWQYMMRFSSEPQYLLSFRIVLEEHNREEEGETLNDMEGTSLAEFFSEIEELRSYVTRLKQMTYKDLHIRSIAEFYYMDGLTVREVVRILISTKLLPEYDEEDVNFDNELTNNHIKRISNYFKGFKNYDLEKFKDIKPENY